MAQTKRGFNHSQHYWSPVRFIASLDTMVQVVLTEDFLEFQPPSPPPPPQDPMNAKDVRPSVGVRLDDCAFYLARSLQRLGAISSLLRGDLIYFRTNF